LNRAPTGRAQQRIAYCPERAEFRGLAECVVRRGTPRIHPFGGSGLRTAASWVNSYATRRLNVYIDGTPMVDSSTRTRE
jgi:hypothetical protein